MKAQFLLGFAVALVAACYDPVHQDDVAALGDESPSVPPGPFHRPGQPCLTCHSGDGPGDSVFAIAGTVYQVRGGTLPLDSATITITDAKGDSRGILSNGAGNFFVRESDWKPTFPVRAMIESNGIQRKMTTTIGRNGACATCHRDAGDRTFMPGVFLRDK